MLIDKKMSLMTLEFFTSFFSTPESSSFITPYESIIANYSSSTDIAYQHSLIFFNLTIVAQNITCFIKTIEREKNPDWFLIVEDFGPVV